MAKKNNMLILAALGIGGVILLSRGQGGDGGSTAVAEGSTAAPAQDGLGNAGIGYDPALFPEQSGSGAVTIFNQAPAAATSGGGVDPLQDPAVSRFTPHQRQVIASKTVADPAEVSIVGRRTRGGNIVPSVSLPAGTVADRVYVPDSPVALVRDYALPPAQAQDFTVAFVNQQQDEEIARQTYLAGSASRNYRDTRSDNAKIAEAVQLRNTALAKRNLQQGKHPTRVPVRSTFRETVKATGQGQLTRAQARMFTRAQTAYNLEDV